MSLDTTALASSMIDAARAAVAEQWPALSELAEMELSGLAHSVARVTAMYEAGGIDRSRAQQLVYMHQASAASVLETVRGIGVLSANTAVRAASGAAASVINHLVGFKLLRPDWQAVSAFKAGKDL